MHLSQRAVTSALAACWLLVASCSSTGSEPAAVGELAGATSIDTPTATEAPPPAEATTTTGVTTTSTEVTASTEVTGVAATQLLDQLTIADEHAAAPYDRSLFDHWIDADGDGCAARCEVLEREHRLDLDGLHSGGWLSLYDGYTTDDPTELQIDHVVALSEAWRSGAWAWDMATRRAFANDLDSPALTAVTAATNQSKSDRDPSSWQPPNRDGWCQYATSWVVVKVRWRLTAQPAEVDALRNMLAGCTIESAEVVAAPITAAPSTPTTTSSPPPAVAPQAPDGAGCDPSYPDVCIPHHPPDLNCGDVPHRRFRVLPPDPHRFDGNNDGVGCES